MQNLSDLTKEMKAQFGSAYKISDKVLAEAVLTVRLASVMGYNKLTELKDAVVSKLRVGNQNTPITTPTQQTQPPEPSRRMDFSGIAERSADEVLEQTRNFANDEHGYDTTKGLLFEGVAKGIGGLAKTLFAQKEDDLLEENTAQETGASVTEEYLAELQFISDKIESLDDASIEMGVATLHHYEDSLSVLKEIEKHTKDMSELRSLAVDNDIDPENPTISDKLERLHESLEKMRVSDTEYHERVLEIEKHTKDMSELRSLAVDNDIDPTISDKLERLHESLEKMRVSDTEYHERVSDTEYYERVSDTEYHERVLEIEKHTKDMSELRSLAVDNDIDPENPTISDKLERLHESLEKMRVSDTEYHERVLEFFELMKREAEEKKLDDLEASRENSVVRSTIKEPADSNEPEQQNGIVDFLKGLFSPDSMLLIALSGMTKVLKGIRKLLSGITKAFKGIGSWLARIGKFVTPLIPFLKAAGRILLRFAGPIGLAFGVAELAHAGYKAFTGDDETEKKEPRNPTNETSDVNRALDVASNEFGMDKTKMAAVAQRESGLNSDISSDTGAKGLFQFTKSTWNGLASKKENQEILRKYSIAPITGDQDQRDNPTKNAIMYGLLSKENEKKYKASTGDEEIDSYIKHYLGGPTGDKVISAVAENPDIGMDKLASYAYNSSKTNRAMLSDDQGTPLTGGEFIRSIRSKIDEDTAIAIDKLSLEEPTTTSFGVIKSQQNDEKIKMMYNELEKQKEMPMMPTIIGNSSSAPTSITPITSPAKSTGVLPSRNPSSTLQRLLDRDMVTAG